MASNPKDPSTSPMSPPKNRLSRNSKHTFAEKLIIFGSFFVAVLLFPVAICFCIKMLHEFQRAVVFRLGRLKEKNPVGPGIICFLPCVDTLAVLDLRVKSFDVPPQEAITKDAVTIQVDAIVYYRITDPVECIIQVEDFDESTKFIAQTTLRNVIGGNKLWEIITNKGEISKEVGVALDKITDNWGIKVERVEIKDIQLPESLQRSMAAEAEALCEARAKIVAAEGELSSSKALREASDIMASNPITLQLRYLQTLSIISHDTKSTVIFPFPMELMELGGGGGDGSKKK